MKIKNLIILFLFTLSAQYLYAQPLDTLAYLKNFEQQKAKYIGQPLSLLLNAMGKVQPISIWRG